MALYEIVGSFVFRNEGDGCLTSKFLANTDGTPHTESCKRQTAEVPNQPFVGTFRTTWLQPRTTGNTTLEIVLNGAVYDLYWNGCSPRYQGKAMMFEGKLVGSYWSID